MKSLNLLIVDDHPLLRSGLRQLLVQWPKVGSIAEASTGGEALALALASKSDLIIMDIHLPDMTGIDATSRIVEALPGARVVVFSGDADRALVDAALQAGASGYILKESMGEEVLRALECVAGGRLYLSPELGAGTQDKPCKPLTGEVATPRPALSDREKRLMQLIADGKRSKEIATELWLSTKSIEMYRSRLMRKVGCGSSAELVRFAIREGIVVP